ncbi:hypothetical protein TSOC_001725 [Tetrabaena socialis]|uniref:Uncharacterized protein n=1 Tax=Tetrabaena socialis TaxID=47790 RepID=A0A2J8AG09_9CHLO|nr:hypothetical protein TSOC_001725 [Tetrabaena socialis]|eukprot:PNH11449.1 hypothetical protein TSOC_001725 [Tetrabaena socialis]
MNVFGPAACGPDGAAREALQRSLHGLHTLLPDLQPHWQEQLGLHASLLAIEGLLRGGGGGNSASGGGGTAPPSLAPIDLQHDLYSDAQRAAAELQGLASFIRRYGSRASSGCYDQCSWAVAEALDGAARNYCGPGSVLLRSADTELAATAVRSLRRSHEAHLSALVRVRVGGLAEQTRGPAQARQGKQDASGAPGKRIERGPSWKKGGRLERMTPSLQRPGKGGHRFRIGGERRAVRPCVQVRLAMSLPQVSVRLVELRQACTEPGLDVGRMAATNLGLLLLRSDDVTALGSRGALPQLLG